MPLPIAIVGYAVAGVVTGVVAGVITHTDYSDAAYRRRQEQMRREAEAARAREAERQRQAEHQRQMEEERIRRQARQREFDSARGWMDGTVRGMIDRMRREVGPDGAPQFQDMAFDTDTFDYADLERDWAKLDGRVRERLEQVVREACAERERRIQEELDEVNGLIRKISQTRLRG